MKTIPRCAGAVEQSISVFSTNPLLTVTKDRSLVHDRNRRDLHEESETWPMDPYGTSKRAGKNL
jgi:hypothetical protein